MPVITFEIEDDNLKSAHILDGEKVIRIEREARHYLMNALRLNGYTLAVIGDRERTLNDAADAIRAGGPGFRLPAETQYVELFDKIGHMKGEASTLSQKQAREVSNRWFNHVVRATVGIHEGKTPAWHIQEVNKIGVRIDMEEDKDAREIRSSATHVGTQCELCSTTVKWG